jgi:hypothetical protein
MTIRGSLVSSNVPPSGPTPDAGGPEYLEHGGGAPYTRPDEPGSGGGKRTAIIGGGVVAVLALAGAGVWAATSFFATGAQPAEALPDSTIAYVSIDLDPSGQQKIEALKMLRKFPAFKKEVGLQTDDDLRKKLFEEIQKSDACPGLDYGDDVEPWLGERAALAAVDTGEKQPAPVFVAQVTDEAEAEAGLKKLTACGVDDGAAPEAGWAVANGWAVIAETDDIAGRVSDDAAESPLADDSDFQRWTGEAGDAGIMTFYAAPAAGQYLADNLSDLTDLNPLIADGDSATSSGTASATASAQPSAYTSSRAADDCDGGATGALTESLKDFQGAAATLRFDDGSVELELAGDSGVTEQGIEATDRGDDVLATLPDDTAAAIGVGFPDHWFDGYLQQLEDLSCGELDRDQLIADVEEETGLQLPDDVEALTGRSAALSVGADFDVQRLDSTEDGSDIPVALKVTGDADEIGSVLDKVRGQLPPEAAGIVGSDADGDTVVIGPDAAYRTDVLENGGLGSSETFKGVVREAGDAAAVLFVNFDAGDGWLLRSGNLGRAEVDNLEPLAGFGISGWQDGDVSHAALRLTTN